MHKLKFILITAFVSILFFTVTAKNNKKSQLASKREYNVISFGAIPDGKTLNTKAIQKAIDTANKDKSGGKVIFPTGQFLTGSIELKSNVELYFAESAVLLGSTNPNDYIAMDATGRPQSPKYDDNSQLALILAHNANNIKLYGKGVIDGQGRELALNIDSLHHAGVKIDPKYNYGNKRPNETARPKLFRFSQCNNVKVQDLDIQSSACWGLSFELCEDLLIDNIKLTNRAYWNNDGMDITDCKNVTITNCDVNAADDGICLKSYYPDYANENIYIANCSIRSSASAIKFGTASYGGFKNITIENIKVFDTFRSAIAIESVDGGAIENVKIQNITATNTGNAIFIRLGHRGGEKPGTIKNVQIKNMKVEIPFGRPDIDYDIRGPEVPYFHNPFPASIVGIPENAIENISLENIEITYPGRSSKGMAYLPLSRLHQVPENIKNYPEFDMFGELPAWGMYVRHAKGLHFKNLTFKLENDDFRPAFVFDDVNNLQMENIDLPKSNKKDIILRNVQNLQFDSDSNSIKQDLQH